MFALRTVESSTLRPRSLPVPPGTKRRLGLRPYAVAACSGTAALLPAARLQLGLLTSLLLLTASAHAEGTFADLQWGSNASCESWVSGFTNDTAGRHLNAVVHLTPAGAGELEVRGPAADYDTPNAIVNPTD